MLGLLVREGSAAVWGPGSEQAGAWGHRVEGDRVGLGSPAQASRAAGRGGVAPRPARAGAQERGGRKRWVESMAELGETVVRVVPEYPAGDPMRQGGRGRKLTQAERGERFTTAGPPVRRPVGQELLRTQRNVKRKAQKAHARGPQPDRNAQFENRAQLNQRSGASEHPLVSQDTKKTELGGNWDRPGQLSTPEVGNTFAPDFPRAALGGGSPPGVDDLTRKVGQGNWGTRPDPSEAACDRLRRGGESHGQAADPRAPAWFLL